jgi:hypothetical protein
VIESLCSIDADEESAESLFEPWDFDRLESVCIAQEILVIMEDPG